LGTYVCGIWKIIQELEKDVKYPMCGSGCSSTLFNKDREKVINNITRKATQRILSNGKSTR
jgi:hypothetical protein